MADFSAFLKYDSAADGMKLSNTAGWETTKRSCTFLFEIIYTWVTSPAKLRVIFNLVEKSNMKRKPQRPQVPDH